MSLSASCKEENMFLQVVKTSMLNEETRRKDKSALSQSEANVSSCVSPFKDLYKKCYLAHFVCTECRVLLFEIEFFSVFCSLCLPRVLFVFFKLSIKPSFIFCCYPAEQVVSTFTRNSSQSTPKNR